MDITIIVSILSIIILLIMIIIMIRYLNKEIQYTSSKINSNNYFNTIRYLKYTEKILEFIKQHTIRITTIKFYEFLDKIDISKINQEITKKFINELAETSYNSIDWDKINDNLLLISKEYINSYIIDLCIITTKELIEKSIYKIEE